MYTVPPGFSLFILGQASQISSDQSVSGAPSSAVKIQSVLDFVIKGGPLMIPIAACSFIALTVVIERLFSLRRKLVAPPAFVPGLKDLLDNDHSDKKKTLDYCDAHPSPLSRVFAAGIKRLGEPVESLEKRIQETGEREVLKLRKYLRVLVVIASIAPLLGLLGTIFGMIEAFQTVAISGESLGKAELLAKGIYLAMITTAAGLLVTIPVLIAYHWFSGRIEQLVAEMDALTVEFLEEYRQNRTGRFVSHVEAGIDDSGNGAKAKMIAAVTTMM